MAKDDKGKKQVSIYFEPLAWLRMRGFTIAAPGEVSGIGQVELVNENGEITLIVKNVWIWEQVCGPAHTEITDHDAVFSLVDDLEKEGIPSESLKLWWHSHADMNAFFSSTDTQQMSDWQSNSYLVSVVTNKAGEAYASVDVRGQFPQYIDDVPVTYNEEIPENIMSETRAEVDKKVKAATMVEPSRGSDDIGFYPRDGYDNGYRDHYSESAENCSCELCKLYLFDIAEGTFKNSVNYAGYRSPTQQWWDTHEYDSYSGIYVLKSAAANDVPEDRFDESAFSEDNDGTLSDYNSRLIYRQSAEECGCKQCRAYIKRCDTKFKKGGSRIPIFPAKSHTWDETTGLFVKRK